MRIEITDGKNKEIIELDDRKLKYDKDDFLSYCRAIIEESTGKKIELTGGPYRGYDISIEFKEDGTPKVDVYTPMRIEGWQGDRVMNALTYVIRCIKAGKILDPEDVK